MSTITPEREVVTVTDSDRGARAAFSLALTQFTVASDPWGHLSAPSEAIIRGQSADLLELRDAAWEDEAGRIPLDPDYAGQTPRRAPVDPEVEAARAAFRAQYKARLAAGRPGVPAPIAEPVAVAQAPAAADAAALPAIIAEAASPARAAERKRNQMAVRERNRRRERERFLAAKAKVKRDRAVCDARPREPEVVPPLVTAPPEPAPAASTAPRRARGRPRLDTFTDAALTRGRGLYVNERKSFAAAVAALREEGLLTSASPTDTLAAELRREALRAGWPLRGRSGGACRLSDGQLRSARTLYDTGLSFREVAELLGLDALYATPERAVVALSTQFAQRGWPARSLADGRALKAAREGRDESRDLVAA